MQPGGAPGAMGDGAAAAAAPATPGPKRSGTAPTGMTPEAKRAANLVVMQAPDGPLMDQGELNAAVYRMQRQLAAVDKWIGEAQPAIEDHAQRFDSLKPVLSEHAARLDLGADDLKELLTRVSANDAELKKNLGEMSVVIENNDLSLKGQLDQCVEANDQKLKQVEGKIAEAMSAAHSATAAAQILGGSTFAGSSGAAAAAATTTPQVTASDLGVVSTQVATLRAEAITEIQAHAVAIAEIRSVLSGFSGPGAFTGSYAQAAGDPMKGEHDPWGRFQAGRATAGQGAGTRATTADDQRQRPPTTTTEHHDMTHDDSPQRSSIPAGPKVTLDKKLALLDKHQYDDHKPDSWHKNIRTYMIGCHVDMKGLLDWIERRGEAKVRSCDLMILSSGTGGASMMDLDPLHASNEMWSWLSLCLGKSAHAQRLFNNVEELNGAEAYRKLVVPMLSTSIVRRTFLRKRVENPQRSKSMATIMDCVDLWEENLIALKKAGGREQEEEDKKAQLMDMLPLGVSFELMSAADEQADSDSLIEWMRKKSRFVQEYGGNKEVHVAEAVAEQRKRDLMDYEADARAGAYPPPPPFELGESELEASEEDMAKMTDAEILAFVRRGGTFSGRGKFPRRPAAGGQERVFLWTARLFVFRTRVYVFC